MVRYSVQVPKDLKNHVKIKLMDGYWVMVLTSSDIQCKILIIIINTTTHRCYHEALVDVVCLLQGFPLALCLLCHLAAGKVDKVDLAVPGQLTNCW